jgi:hypothetical protein
VVHQPSQEVGRHDRAGGGARRHGHPSMVRPGADIRSRSSTGFSRRCRAGVRGVLVICAGQGHEQGGHCHQEVVAGDAGA